MPVGVGKDSWLSRSASNWYSSDRSLYRGYESACGIRNENLRRDGIAGLIAIMTIIRLRSTASPAAAVTGINSGIVEGYSRGTLGHRQSDRRPGNAPEVP